MALLVLLSVRYNKEEFVDDYLSMDTTNMTKGIFIILVFIKHATPYVISAGWTPHGIFGEIFYFINSNVGQWIVAMFLFYSGYGIMESIKRKGRDYVHQIPRKRFLRVLVNFDIAVIAFILVGLLMRTPLTVKQCLLSFIGWESVGNSNWYIFVILVMYLATYVSFYKGEAGNYKASLWVMLIQTLVICVILSYFKTEYWYNTMFCYNAGLFFSAYKGKAEGFVRSYYWIILIVSVLTLLVIDRIPYSVKGLVYNGFALVFCAVVVLSTMKFKIDSQVLLWCGKNLFPLYIYQRVPMIILASVSDGAFAANYPFLFTSSSLLITILMTLGYNKYIAVKL